MRRCFPPPPRILLLLGVLLGCAAAAAPAPARAQAPPADIRVRTGTHPGFGRVVFDFPERVPYRMSREADRVVLAFDDPAMIGPAAELPRNARGLTGGPGRAEILLTPGTRVRVMRIGNGIVLDLLDRALPPPAAGATPPPAAGATPPPAAGANSTPAGRSPVAAPAAPAAPAVPAATGPVRPATAAPAAAEAASAPPAITSPSAESPAVAPPPAAAPPLAAASRTAAAAPSGPLSLAAAPLALPPGVAGRAMTLPFAATTAVAAFAHHGEILLVFDERRPIDLGAMRGDPVFGRAIVQLLPAATVIRFPASVAPSGAPSGAPPGPPPGLTLARGEDGWTVTAGGASAAVAPIVAVPADRQIGFVAAAPGGVVNVADPATGGQLLVGTQREPGQGLPVGRRAGEFVLLRTWQGVALEPLSDGIFLRTAKPGFLLGAEPAGLALSPVPVDTAVLADAASATRRFDFPPLPTERLERRLQAEMEAVASAAPLARGPKRRQAAATMVALGLGAEAAAMLRLAATEDAREADNPDALGLTGIAALLADRPADSEGLADPRLSGSDEIAFWRSVRTAAEAATAGDEASDATSAAFAAGLPLALSYPAGLRDRLLPLLAETLALHRSPAAAKLLADRKDDASLALARAIWQERSGERDAALAGYDALAASPDRLTRVRAAVRGAELRLAAGLLDAVRTADILERQVFAWRGDQRELALRLRVAALRAQAGAFRAALSGLREAEAAWPEQAKLVRRKLSDTFAALLGDNNADRLSPLDLVALLDENADLLPTSGAAATATGSAAGGAAGGPDGGAGAVPTGVPEGALAARLADRLLALDLPARAAPLLTRIMQAASGEARAQVGGRLAALRLRDDDAPGALAALAASEAAALPEPLAQDRLIQRARALARVGDVDQAVGLLTPVGGAEAREALAQILEAARRWPEAAHALADYAAGTLPATGALDEGQRRTVLRLAGDLAQAGDAAGLAALRERETARMAPGPLGDMFRLLTAGPVRRGADLPRAGREIALARGVEDGLKAMDAAPPPR